MDSKSDSWQEMIDRVLSGISEDLSKMFEGSLSIQ